MPYRCCRHRPHDAFAPTSSRRSGQQLLLDVAFWLHRAQLTQVWALRSCSEGQASRPWRQRQVRRVRGRGAGAHLLAVERPVDRDDARLCGQVAVHAAAHLPEVDLVVVRHRNGVADGLALRRRFAACPGDRGAGVLVRAAAVAKVWAGVISPARGRRVVVTSANAGGRCTRLCATLGARHAPFHRR